MKLNCPYCGETIVYDASRAGQALSCSYCRKPIRMPTVEELPEDRREELQRESARKEKREERNERRQERRSRKELDRREKQKGREKVMQEAACVAASAPSPEEPTELRCVICACGKTYEMVVFEGAKSRCPHCGQAVVATSPGEDSAELAVFATRGFEKRMSRLWRCVGAFGALAFGIGMFIGFCKAAEAYNSLPSEMKRPLYPSDAPEFLWPGFVLGGILAVLGGAVGLIVGVLFVRPFRPRQQGAPLVSFPVSEMQATEESYNESPKKAGWS